MLINKRPAALNRVVTAFAVKSFSGIGILSEELE